MVVGEGDKGVYRKENLYVVYGKSFKVDIGGNVIRKRNYVLTNPFFKQIVSGKLTQWEDYT